MYFPEYIIVLFPHKQRAENLPITYEYLCDLCDLTDDLYDLVVKCCDSIVSLGSVNQEVLAQCRFNVGLLSKTMGQH